MVRLWRMPDGSFLETVYAREDPDTVARANATLAAQYPGAVPEDYANDEYEAMKPRRPDGSVDPRVHKWRRRGDRIVVDDTVPDPAPTLVERIEVLERRLGL